VILDKITIALNVVIAACAFSTGWTLARYIDAVQAEKVAAIALQDKLERDKVVIKQQADLIAYQDREAEIKRQADEGERNANQAIQTVMDIANTHGVQIVPISRLCASDRVSPSDSPASSVSPASTVFEQYDASVAALRQSTIEAIRACEVDRESVIRQAGGR
jgi:hypothetical protein